MIPHRTLRATLEYEGTRYRGWQSQVNARTVQGVLLRAAREVLGERTTIQGAGRTDAGVHAFAQVASIHLAADAPKELGTARRDLNDKLPPDIHILRLDPAPPSFHARHDALVRFYRYRISRRRTAFGKPFVWWVRDHLDVAAMERAAAGLAGRHDFAAFCENSEGHSSTLVEVSFARVFVPNDVPDLVLFRIGASHFLWKMVRRLVGAIVQVGIGKLPEKELARLLAEPAAPSKVAEWTAPPSGLFLEGVSYPDDPPLADIHPLRPAL